MSKGGLQETNDVFTDFLNSVEIKNGNNFLTIATVLDICEKDVIVMVTNKYTATISLDELKDIPGLKVGSTFDVFVEQLEDKKGQIIVSRSDAEVVRKWEKLNLSLTEGIVVHGIIKDKLPGGVNVNVNGITVFLPVSQIGSTEVENFNDCIGKDIDVIVTKINKKTKNVIVSHKLILENAIKAQEKAIISQIEKGQIVEGIVDSIVPYGAFINIGGVVGLLHICDISWTRIAHPNEILKVGDKIKVVVTDCDPKTQKISFGLKYLTPSPWDKLDKDNIKVGNVVEGKVINIVDFGAFIEVIPGVEGLLHIADLSWNLQAPAIKSIFKVGDIVKTKIIDLNVEEKKLSLGLKQLTDDPWAKDDLDNIIAIGSKHTCEVIAIKSFGVIVELKNGLYGFIHETDLTWSHRKNKIEDFVKLHDKVDAVVLSFDKASRKLSLGLKQLKENPWNVYENDFQINSIHDAIILKKQPKGFFVQLDHNLVGVLNKDHIPHNVVLNVGDKIQVKIIIYDKDNMKINVVHKDYQYIKPNTNNASNVSTGKKITFGDILKKKE